MRVLKVGAHFVLYLPVGVPLVGEEGADPAQKWNVEADDVAALLDGLSDGWTMLEDETRQDGDEFGHLWVLRKEAASVRVRPKRSATGPHRNARPQPTSRTGPTRLPAASVPRTPSL